MIRTLVDLALDNRVVVLLVVVVLVGVGLLAMTRLPITTSVVRSVAATP